MGPELLPMVFTSGWASGVNAYAVVLVLGLFGRFGGVDSVPPALQRTDVLVVALLLFAVELVADKVPYLDSAWDAAHTFVRPVVGAALGLLIAGDASSLQQRRGPHGRRRRLAEPGRALGRSRRGGRPAGAGLGTGDLRPPPHPRRARSAAQQACQDAHLDSPLVMGRRASPVLLRVSAALAATVVLAQIAYPLTSGEPLRLLTIGTVLCFPLIVPLAWVMMSYPCLLLGRRLGGGRRALVALSGGLTLAAWDLFLDPQMVAAGRWTWAHPVPALPGVPGIPVTNFVGWLLVAVVMLAVLDAALSEDDDADATVPAALLAWTWIGSTIGNAVFFHRPAVALWGGVAMGVCSGPYLLSQLRSRDRRAADQRHRT